MYILYVSCWLIQGLRTRTIYPIYFCGNTCKHSCDCLFSDDEVFEDLSQFVCGRRDAFEVRDSFGLTGEDETRVQSQYDFLIILNQIPAQVTH